ncbi:unnamed protein product [Chondrus crispus]|uniref:Uncharacterized protein n=1 Tax=Chondrus crispus TaxID=2769 RepID=R7QS61_CHOCR|nr:unnamed protein product [Chondrus crispus]CDF40954.1 unnamed protein product [Chondrus crispus]|eukprot:XP_005711248.1 unnamed protein product [Chondrus crispus]
MQTKPPSIAHSERRFMSSLSENASPTEDSIVTHGNQMDPSFVSEETFATFNSIFGPLSKVTKTAMGGGNVCPTCSKVSPHHLKIPPVSRSQSPLTLHWSPLPHPTTTTNMKDL